MSQQSYLVGGEYYERRAEYCEQMAREAPTPDLRLDWLRLADQWRQMIRRGSEEHSLPEDRTEPHPAAHRGDREGQRERRIGPHEKNHR